MKETEFNDMQRVKRQFFAFRNGIIADALRKAGSPYRIIFGVNMPQLMEIATETGQSANLAERLWANNSTRESQLIAPMLFPANDFSREDALRWLDLAAADEAIDVLCLKLLKNVDFALQLAAELLKSDSRKMRYTALRLMWNLVGTHRSEVAALVAGVSAVENNVSLRNMAERLNEECSFLESFSPGL